MLVLPFFTMLWNCHKAKILQCPSLFGTKQQLRRDVVHMHSPQESPSHTASSKRNIADIEQGQWWIQAEYRFCDIGSCFIHNSKADISWPVKSWKHLKSCGIQALGWQLFPHGSIFKRTWSWMLVVALDLRVGKLHQSHVACRSCSFELHWASSLHFFVDTDTCGFSLEETLDESYLQGRPWMQLLDRLPNSRRSSYFISRCFSPIDTFLVELFLWIHHFWKGLETWLFTSFTHISLWDARASQEDLVI